MDSFQWEDRPDNFDQTEYQTEWVSKSSRQTVSVMESHRLLFGRADASLSLGFASIQRALIDLQLQLQIKVREMRDQQQHLLTTTAPSGDAIDIMEDHMRKIDRSLDTFTIHADNLSLIKLTLARAANLVSIEGNLASLVTSPNSVSHSVPKLYTSPIHIPSSSLHATLTRPGNGQPAQHTPTQTLARTPKSTCFVFYLPQSLKRDGVMKLFQPYGSILNVFIPCKEESNHQGYCFVDFSTPAEAQAAVHALDKFYIDGKCLSVSIKV